MERVTPVVDDTIKALAKTKFVQDPVAGTKYSRATSIVSSAYKRHGRILETALRESLRESNRHKVWQEDAFRVSRAADALVGYQSEDACRQSTGRLAAGHSRCRGSKADYGARDAATGEWWCSFRRRRAQRRRERIIDMTYALKTPLAIDKVDSSATFYRTHLGHRENATSLAIKLIRRAVAIEKAEFSGDVLAEELVGIAEPWAVDHILQGCYIEEYHQWEKAIKYYFKAQRTLNVVGGDFDWRSGNKSMVQRAIDALSFFSASIDADIFSKIEKVRETVNAMKHDPLSVRVNEANYQSAVKTFEQFWEGLMAIEGKSFA